MSLFNESDWEAGDFGPHDVHDNHDHCDVCGVCADENELAQESGPPQWQMDTDWVDPYALVECLPCRIRGISDDCGTNDVRKAVGT